MPEYKTVVDCCFKISFVANAPDRATARRTAFVLARKLLEDLDPDNVTYPEARVSGIELQVLSVRNRSR